MALRPAVSGDAGKDAGLRREKENLPYERKETNGLVAGGGGEISRKFSVEAETRACLRTLQQREKLTISEGQG